MTSDAQQVPNGAEPAALPPGALSEEEFMAAYRARMAALRKATAPNEAINFANGRDGAAPAAGTPVAAAAAAAVPQGAGAAGEAIAAAGGDGGWMANQGVEWLKLIAGPLGVMVKIFFACMLFTQGNYESKEFRNMFLGISGVMILQELKKRIKVKVALPEAPPLQAPRLESDTEEDEEEDEDAIERPLAAEAAGSLEADGSASGSLSVDGADESSGLLHRRVALSPEERATRNAEVAKRREVVREKRRKEFAAKQSEFRRKVAIRKVSKVFSTFFVSLSPTWRVETLQAELIADGIVPDPRRRN